MGQSFLKGAAILGISTVIVKLMGMVYKIILSSMLGGVGTGLFNSAYALYNPLFVLSTAGFPIAISRMVSESVARKRYRDVRQIHRISVPFFVLVGMICFIAMILGGFIYVKVIHSDNAIFAILALSPTIFFGCLMTIYRGYFQGMKNMMPTAVSEIIEACGKLFLGLAAAILTMNFGMQQYYDTGYVLGVQCKTEADAQNVIMPIAVGAAIMGISIGAVLGLLYLIVRMKHGGDNITREMLVTSPKERERSRTIRILIRTAVPIGLNAIVMSLGDSIDAILVQRRIGDIVENQSDVLLNLYGSLIPDAVYSAGNTAVYLYGCYGMALTLMMLITSVTQVFGVTALPAVTAAYTSGNKRQLKKSVETVLRITSLITIPSGLGMAVLAEPLMSLIYSSPSVSNEVEISSRILAVMGVSVIFIAISTPIFSMLQAVGRVDAPLKLMTVGMILKIVTNYILVGIPEINVQGANYGSLVCYLFVTAAAMFILCREAKIVPNFVSIFIKPLLAAILCAAAAYFSEQLLDVFFAQNIATILAVLIAVVVYVISLFLFKAVSRNDILQMPKGNKIVKVLEKRHLIR